MATEIRMRNISQDARSSASLFIDRIIARRPDSRRAVPSVEGHCSTITAVSTADAHNHPIRIRSHARRYRSTAATNDDGGANIFGGSIVITRCPPTRSSRALAPARYVVSISVHRRMNRQRKMEPRLTSETRALGIYVFTDFYVGDNQTLSRQVRPTTSRQVLPRQVVTNIRKLHYVGRPRKRTTYVEATKRRNVKRGLVRSIKVQQIEAQ